jgi:hypothetical protein
MERSGKKDIHGKNISLPSLRELQFFANENEFAAKIKANQRLDKHAKRSTRATSFLYAVI